MRFGRFGSRQWADPLSPLPFLGRFRLTFRLLQPVRFFFGGYSLTRFRDFIHFSWYRRSSGDFFLSIGIRFPMLSSFRRPLLFSVRVGRIQFWTCWSLIPISLIRRLFSFICRSWRILLSGFSLDSLSLAHLGCWGS